VLGRREGGRVHLLIRTRLTWDAVKGTGVWLDADSFAALSVYIHMVPKLKGFRSLRKRKRGRTVPSDVRSQRTYAACEKGRHRLINGGIVPKRDPS
jgi:hypothetical protein